MQSWAELYESPAALSREWGHHRIYAPAAYRLIRTARLVPIVHHEALDLARLFPICWTMTPDGPLLCVLRSLLGAGEGFPGGAKSAAAVLPLAFQCYPVVAPDEQGESRQPIIVDRAIADSPTDIGAPLMMADGKLSRAAGMRVRKAQQIARAAPLTRTLSQRLHEAEMLEPWPLSFGLGDGEKIDIGRLWVLARARLGEPALHEIIRDLGPEAGLFLSAHRLSLFRIASLLSAAKTARVVRRQHAAA